MTIPDRSIRISADRGGTFCDVHASYPDPADPSKRKDLVVKLLSQDPANYPDAPTEGIRRILQTLTGTPIPRGTPLATDKIASIRLSTTIATNALLERTGAKHALLITRGFADALRIGNQARPDIFDLNIRRAPPLYDAVVEVDERVTLVGYASDPAADAHAVQFDDAGNVVRGYRGNGWDGVGDAEGPGEVVRGLSGEAVRILKKPDTAAVRADLERLYAAGFRSVAIVLVHSYTYPAHEQLVASLARAVGFPHVAASAALLPMIKLVPRGASATADAYLTPVLRAYLDGFFAGFDARLRAEDRVEFMASDGGLVGVRGFSGLRSVLSGPAGGVVGYALTSWDEDVRRPVIGLDVGGTSTDVSRFAGRYEVVYETTTAGVALYAPQLDINTVAAGGGSCLAFRAGLFAAGPASAGAEPGPVCYRKGGPLAVTDANLVLGRLLPAYFPHIFGPTENEPLDADAAAAAFAPVVAQVNQEYGRELSLDEVAYGFIKVANETMCRPIRALTEGRGHAAAQHILASFGGAGGQHACEIARLLGIKTVLIHRYSSILSAYGLALADRAHELQEPAATAYTAATAPALAARLDALEARVRAALAAQGFPAARVRVARLLHMRFAGTDSALMVPAGPDGDFGAAFRAAYRAEFGFVPAGAGVVVDDVKVRGVGRAYDALGESVFAAAARLRPGRAVARARGVAPVAALQSVYFEGAGRVEAPVYELPALAVGDAVEGPAVVIDDTQTIVLVPGAHALVTPEHLYITLE